MKKQHSAAAPAMGKPRHPRPEGLAGELAGRIEALRKGRGMSSRDLASAAGVGFGTIQRIEAGSASPSVDTVSAIALALGITPHRLMRPCPSWSGYETAGRTLLI